MVAARRRAGDSARALKDAVRREVLEETGLEVEPLERVRDLRAHHARRLAASPEYHYVLIDYVCRVTGGKLCARRRRLRASNGCAARDLARLQITEGTLAVIEKAFRRTRENTK